MSVQHFSISDDKLIEIMNDANTQLESRLRSIKSSIGLFDFVLDMSNMWSTESFPIKGEDSFNGDKAKYFIFKKIMGMCKLELARRRVLMEAKDEKQYLASLIRANKILTSQEVRIEL